MELNFKKTYFFRFITQKVYFWARVPDFDAVVVCEVADFVVVTSVVVIGDAVVVGTECF